MVKVNGFEPRIMVFLSDEFRDTVDGSTKPCFFRAPSNTLVTRVASPLRIKNEHIVKALASGIDGVLIPVCSKTDGAGRVIGHSRSSKYRIFKRLLKHLGFEPERVAVKWLQPEEQDNIDSLVNDFTEELRNLGPNNITRNFSEPVMNLDDIIKYRRWKPVDDHDIGKLLEDVKEFITSMFKQGEVDGVVGLKNECGHVVPSLFRSAPELKNLELAPKYMLAKDVRAIQKQYPDLKLGVLAYACDHRAILDLARRKQVNLDKLRMIGLTCLPYKTGACVCTHPDPPKIDIGSPTEKNDLSAVDSLIARFRELGSWSAEKRLEFWSYQFSKCIKCYGCRDACPTCTCGLRKLENEKWVGRGRIPPEFPTFHFIRLMHMADKCVGCGECEAACPVDIPLMLLHLMVAEDMRELFDYEAGCEAAMASPLKQTPDIFTTEGDGT